MKILIIVLITVLSGCSWIESFAGKSRYTYTRIDPDGTKHIIDLKNAKDIGLVSATLIYGEVRVELIEEGVSASGPMTVMAENNRLLLDAVLNKVP